MKKMNKVIAAMMVMALTTTTARASNNVDKNARPGKKEMRMADKRYDRGTDWHNDRQVKALDVTTFKVSAKAARQKNVVAVANAIYGVKNVRWNPRTGVMTVTYDAYITSARKIKMMVG